MSLFSAVLVQCTAGFWSVVLVCNLLTVLLKSGLLGLVSILNIPWLISSHIFLPYSLSSSSRIQ